MTKNNINNINNYNKFLKTLDKKSLIKEKDINDEIDELINSINNKFNININNYIENEYDKNKHNDYIKYLNKDLNIKFYKNIEPIKEINIDIEINSIDDLLYLINTYNIDTNRSIKSINEIDNIKLLLNFII